MKNILFSLVVISILLPGCRNLDNQSAPSSTPARLGETSVTPSQTPSPSRTSTPTQTVVSPTSTPTSTATTVLLKCPDQVVQNIPPQPLQLLYINNEQVWSWDEITGESSQIALAEDVVSPVISPDGTTIAFLQAGQAYDTPEKPVESIPLWLSDLQAGQIRLVGYFSTLEVRAHYPDSPTITLKLAWLPGGKHLLAQVYPYPWGEGILQPAGPLYLVDAAGGTSQLLLEEGFYELYSLHPGGKQIAALDTAALSSGGRWDFDSYQQGVLHLVDLLPEIKITSLPIRLPENPWGFMPPVYSPSGDTLAVNVENGLAILDTTSKSLQVVQLENTCQVENGCEWTDYLPVHWHPDGRFFYTSQTINDFFNERAQTQLSQVSIEPEPHIEAIATIHANPHTFLFSPDRRILAYWNQPDMEEIEQKPEIMNQVTLWLRDMDSGTAIQYTQAFLLRIMSWNPDSHRFIFTYSQIGGANPQPDQLAVGNICQPYQDLVVPKGGILDRVEWLDESRFLAWTLPSDGIANQYFKGLYLYNLTQGLTPQHIADLYQNLDDPYGQMNQVVMIEK